MKYCVCGAMVESHVRYHWLDDDTGHYVNGDHALADAAANRERVAAARQAKEDLPAHLRRASELFGDPPHRAPAFLEVPLKRLWPKKEGEVRKAGLELMRSFGYAVYDLEQGYRDESRGSRQAPGIGDAYFVDEQLGRQGWIEFKRWDNEPSKDQYSFARTVLSAGGIYLLVYETKQLADWHTWGR